MEVPLCEPNLTVGEIENARDAVSSGWLSGYKGKYIDEFEQRFAEYCGCKYAITTPSCYAALLLALEASGIGKGDEVITTTFTMVATLSAIVHSGAKPVLVDVDREMWNMDVNVIEAKITSKTKAIVPVPIYGHPVDMHLINHIAKKHRLLVIEDAAEAIGSIYLGEKYRDEDRMVGSMTHASCFSFYINKMITTGEGGMIVTDSKELTDMAHRLKGYDTDPESRFLHKMLGANYRMTNVQAAIGCAQMDRIEDIVLAKRRIGEQYLSRLKGLDWLQMPAEKDWALNSYWVFGILVKPNASISRNELAGHLKAADIETRNFFVPMHQQPALRNLGLFRKEKYPVAEDIGRRGLYLPNGTTLTEKQVDYVCDRIEEIGK